MLNENIQALRKSKGLSQEELALKLNVVRQTVSKWERGLEGPLARGARTQAERGKADGIQMGARALGARR